MFDKPLPFFIRVWYYKTQKRIYVLKMCSKEMGGLIMANAAGTAQKMRRRKENHPSADQGREDAGPSDHVVKGNPRCT